LVLNLRIEEQNEQQVRREQRKVVRWLRTGRAVVVVVAGASTVRSVMSNVFVVLCCVPRACLAMREGKEIFLITKGIIVFSYHEFFFPGAGHGPVQPNSGSAPASTM
jgi:hypothetical protein